MRSESPATYKIATLIYGIAASGKALTVASVANPWAVLAAGRRESAAQLISPSWLMA